MMILMILLYIVLGIVALILLLGMIAPKKYHVHRSTIINKDKSSVFEFLRYLKNAEKWSPWEEKDPNMNKQFKGTDGEVGALSSWQGNKDVGEGEQEITKIIPDERIESTLRFFKPWKSTSDAYLALNDADRGTKVTWGFSGKHPFIGSIFMLFMNMDKAVGSDFEKGLAKLKTHLEN